MAGIGTKALRLGTIMYLVLCVLRHSKCLPLLVWGLTPLHGCLELPTTGLAMCRSPPAATCLPGAMPRIYHGLTEILTCAAATPRSGAITDPLDGTCRLHSC